MHNESDEGGQNKDESSSLVYECVRVCAYGWSLKRGKRTGGGGRRGGGGLKGPMLDGGKSERAEQSARLGLGIRLVSVRNAQRLNNERGRTFVTLSFLHCR